MNQELSIYSNSQNKLNVNISGYEGPLDLLLELSRKQKVDITKVSILELADQYLKYIRENMYDLNLSADYLVMASFLAFGIKPFCCISSSCRCFCLFKRRMVE